MKWRDVKQGRLGFHGSLWQILEGLGGSHVNCSPRLLPAPPQSRSATADLAKSPQDYRVRARDQQKGAEYSRSWSGFSPTRFFQATNRSFVFRVIHALAYVQRLLLACRKKDLASCRTTQTSSPTSSNFSPSNQAPARVPASCHGLSYQQRQLCTACSRHGDQHRELGRRWRFSRRSLHQLNLNRADLHVFARFSAFGIEYWRR